MKGGRHGRSELGGGEMGEPSRGIVHMKITTSVSFVLGLALTFAIAGSASTGRGTRVSAAAAQAGGEKLQGQDIFRFDTFGDEQLWTRVLRMNEAIATVDPATALSVGLKVDV